MMGAFAPVKRLCFLESERFGRVVDEAWVVGEIEEEEYEYELGGPRSREIETSEGVLRWLE